MIHIYLTEEQMHYIACQIKQQAKLKNKMGGDGVAVTDFSKVEIVDNAPKKEDIAERKPDNNN